MLFRVNGRSIRDGHGTVSLLTPPFPEAPDTPRRALRRSGEQRGQPLQIEQPPHQIRFVSDLKQPSPLEAPKPVPAFRLAPELFDLLPRPLREAVADRSTEPPHSLMDRLPSRRLGRNVGSDPPPHEGSQERFRKITFVCADRLNPTRMLRMERIEQGPSAVCLGGRPTKCFDIDPQQQPMAILHQAVHGIAHHRRCAIALVRQLGLGIGR